MSEPEQVPPGQFVTEKFPVLTYGATPRFDKETWSLRMFGLVQGEAEISYDQFMSLPKRPR